MSPVSDDGPVEAWTVKRRTDANLAAMDLLRRIKTVGPGSRGSEYPADASERRVLLGYSGWGGLSIEAVKDRVPKGMTPDTFGLIHEYYTPKKVADEIARVLCPLLPGNCRAITWTAVEYSQISAQILEALVPSAEVTQGSFEKWIVENPGAKGSYGRRGPGRRSHRRRRQHLGRGRVRW